MCTCVIKNFLEVDMQRLETRLLKKYFSDLEFIFFRSEIKSRSCSEIVLSKDVN